MWRKEWDSNPRWRLTTSVFKTDIINRSIIFPWSLLSESNQRPTVYKTVALPAELRRLGGPGENRTHKCAVQRRQFPISLQAQHVYIFYHPKIFMYNHTNGARTTARTKMA